MSTNAIHLTPPTNTDRQASHTYT